MPILVAAVTWFIVSALSGAPGVGFFIGIVAGVLFGQQKRLTALEAEISRLSSGAALSLPQQTDPVVGAKVEGATTPIPDMPSNQPPVEVPRATPTPEPAVAWPVRKGSSTSETSSGGASSVAAEGTHVTENGTGSIIPEFFLRGNPIARIGVLILFFGVIFALKLAAEEGYFPIELRLCGAVVGSFILLGLGWIVRESRPQFAVTLQGAAVGIFYITSYIAFRLYHLIPGPFAFGLLVITTVIAATFAILQNARSLAVLALVGGFLAPALTSEGGGSHLLLFSYITLLNLGAFGICWFKAWREVNLTAFLFTFLIVAGWGDRYYRPELFSTTEPFLLFLFLLYSGITFLFATRQVDGKVGTVDTLMTFGTPVMVTVFQYGIIKDREYGMALSAFGFGAAYIVMARAIFSKFKNSLRFLVESYFSIGVTLISLAVPLGFSGKVTSAIWALEGVALIWSGIRQRHLLTRFGGELLILLSSLFFIADVQSLYRMSQSPFLNPYFVGVVLLAFANLFAARLLTQGPPEVIGEGERGYGGMLVGVSVAWWTVGGYFELWRYLSDWNTALTGLAPNMSWEWGPFVLAIYGIFASVTVFIYWGLARWFNFQRISALHGALLPLHLVGVSILLVESISRNGQYTMHPFMGIGSIAWILFLLVHYGVLRAEESESQSATDSPLIHGWGMNLVCVVLSWVVFWMVGRNLAGSQSWALSTLLVVPAAVMFGVSKLSTTGRFWPFAKGGAVYLSELKWIGLWLLVCGAWFDITEPGGAMPLPYLPILNPLDISQLLALLVLVVWWRSAASRSAQSSVSSAGAFRILGAWLFVWTTMILLRSVHHYSGVSWQPDALLGSNTVQAALSIFWSLLALVLMSVAHLKSIRPLWKAGAVLIGIVVVKLFLVDLSSQGTLGRIAAFIGVGVLMLCIGYFAPIPPERMRSGDKKKEGI